MIQLDTSFLIRALVRDSPQDKTLRTWLGRGESLAMSAVAWAEFLCGPVDVDQVELVATIVPRRPPFSEADAVVAARLFNETGRRRGSFMDCMIAAVAIRTQAVLATENTGDFRRFEQAGLRIVGG